VVITSNVFQRGSNRNCGNFGPVSSFDTGQPGNQWSNNIWSDGGTVGPAN
jgi:hypothetical protein